MDNDRLILAIGQIERALSRMETASNDLLERQRSAASTPRIDPAAFAELQNRYEALREAAQSAKQQIDKLIETGGA